MSSSLTVHDSRKIFLANNNVRGVLAIYDAPAPKGEQQPKQVFFKTLDQKVAVDDFCVVPSATRHCMTTVKVVAVDVEVDLASQEPVSWIIGRINRAPFERTLAQEAEMLNMIKAAEKAKMVDELKATVFANVDESKIKGLDIAKADGALLIEGKAQ